MGWLGPLCALGASVTWAIGSTGYSRLSRGHSPFAVNFGRATVGFPLFVVSALLLSGPSGVLIELSSIGTERLVWLAISIFASYGLGDVLFMWSTRSLGVPAALAIASTYPLLTAGAGAVLQGETLSWLQIVGLVLSVAGIVTVILSGAQPTPASSDGARTAPHGLTRKRTGVLLAFGAMLMWGLNSYSIARGGQGVDPFVGCGLRLGMALIMCAAFGRLLAPGASILLPRHVYKNALPIFVIEGFIGSAIYLYGLSHSPLAIGSTLSSLAPVLSVPVSWFLGLEKFSIYRTLGVCLVVFGLWLLLGVF